MPSPVFGLRVDLLPGRRLRLDLVGAVVEEPGVGLLRHAPDLAVEGGGLERRRDELVAARVDVRREVVEPLLRRELRRPDHVGREDVALAGLRLLALHELLALLVGRGRELEDLRGHAVLLGVEGLDRGGDVAAGVLAHADRDVALGVVHRADVDRLRAFRLAGGSTAGGAAAFVVVAAARREESPAAQHRKTHQKHKTLGHCIPLDSVSFDDVCEVVRRGRTCASVGARRHVKIPRLVRRERRAVRRSSSQPLSSRRVPSQDPRVVEPPEAGRVVRPMLRRHGR